MQFSSLALFAIVSAQSYINATVTGYANVYSNGTTNDSTNSTTSAGVNAAIYATNSLSSIGTLNGTTTLAATSAVAVPVWANVTNIEAVNTTASEIASDYNRFGINGTAAAPTVTSFSAGFNTSLSASQISLLTEANGAAATGSLGTSASSKGNFSGDATSLPYCTDFEATSSSLMPTSATPVTANTSTEIIQSQPPVLEIPEPSYTTSTTVQTITSCPGGCSKGATTYKFTTTITTSWCPEKQVPYIPAASSAVTSPTVVATTTKSGTSSGSVAEMSSAGSSLIAANVAAKFSAGSGMIACALCMLL